MREVIEKATTKREFGLASLVAGHLVDLVHQRQPAEALEILKKKAEYTRLAGEGDWSQLLDEAHGLQILVELGKASEVLQRVKEMSKLMEMLPEIPAPNDQNVVVWGVRETIFEAGVVAAAELAEWQQAIDFNMKVLQSKVQRRAPILDQARSLFNNYAPLLRLKKLDEARLLLIKCRNIFETHNAIVELSLVFIALADLEDELGHYDEARTFGEASLRYCYVHKIPAHLAKSHFNFSNIIARSKLREAISHCMASILIFAAIGSLDQSLFPALLEMLGRNGNQERQNALSLDFAGVCNSVAQVEGVNLSDLMSSLVADPQDLFATMLAAVAQVINSITKKGSHDE